jgi:hypothetical protein
MAKSTYEVLRCGAGYERLQDALNKMTDEQGEVISILPDHGGGLSSAFGSGQTYGFLIVVRRPA